jgi:two-component system cell cycle sensor histidine kinase/response regulator CckA
MSSLWFVTLLLAQPPTSPPPRASMPLVPLRPATITKAEGVRRLSPKLLEFKPKVVITGVVTHANPVMKDLFVQDDTGGIYVAPLAGDPRVKAGDRVTVRGVADPGLFAPCVAAASVEKVEGPSPAAMPEPIPFDLSLNDSRWLDGQWVQVYGTGESVESTEAYTLLTIRSSRGTAVVTIPGPQHRNRFESFVGMPIKVRGVCVPRFDGNRRIVNGPPRLYISSADQVTAMPIVPDMNQADPPLLIDHLKRFIPAPNPGARRVKVEGVVVARRDRTLTVQDGDTGATVQLRDDAEARVGDRVRVVGQLEITGSVVQVLDAEAAVLGPSALPELAAPTPDELVSGVRHGTRVRVEGHVIEHLPTAYDRPSTIVLVGALRAIVTTVDMPSRLSSLPPGSTVTLSGVLLNDTSSHSHGAFGLHIDESTGLAVAAIPGVVTAWEEYRAFVIISGTLLIAGAAFAWVVLLRRTIERQTADLIAKAAREQELGEKLRQSQKMEAIGRLAGGIAHDFNNLLTVINGSAEILPDVLSNDSTARELAGDIRTAGQKAAGLVAQLLTFSRQRPAQLTALDLNDVLTDAEKLLRRLIGEDLVLVTSQSREIPKVLGEPILLHQVLVNLAVNARDAMPAGGRLSISTTPINGGVRMTVTDTGCGMSPETQAKLFEPFFTTKEVGKGTGLGLATVYGIVQTLGGDIRVHSELGRGTSFEIDLPAAPEEAINLVTPGPITKRNLKVVAARTNVLLVEDDDAVRMLTTRVLEMDGYRVLAAETPAAALKLLEHDTVKILVTDVVMPGMGGRELAERVRSQIPNIKVLFISGYTSDEVLRRGVQEDEVDFLHKPFTPASLSEKVSELMRRTGEKSAVCRVPTMRVAVGV